MSSIDLRTVEVSGSPRELGAGQGEALRDDIQRFVTMRMAAVQKYFADRGQEERWAQVLEVGVKSLALFESWDPDGFEEHVGMATAANIEPSKLFTATNMTDMRDAVLLHASSGPPLGGPSEGGRAPSEGCSSVLVPGSRTKRGQALVGQTWDLNPTDLQYVVAIRRRPKDGLQTWSVTCTGCLTLMGLNENGLAVGTTNIKTYGSGPGVGYLSILHRAVRSANAPEAVEAVRGAPHAGAHTYWVADADQQIEWEASPNGQWRRDTSEGPIYRTNHCLVETHQKIQGEMPGDSSIQRFKRIGQLLQEKQDLDSLRALFSDRRDGVLSVNRYPEDQQGTATNAVFIAEPQARVAWACRGSADRGTWIKLAFD